MSAATLARAARIDRLNIALILASALCALRWPFETLLLAYAVLGPLHYLTEISWLRERDYFLPQRRDVWPLLLGGLLSMVALALAGYGIAQLAPAIGNGLLLAMFGFALVLVLTPRWRRRWLALALLLPACLWLTHTTHAAQSLAGYLLTVVHVYVFTGLFMLLGWLRRPAADSGAALALFLLCPALLLLMPLSASLAPAPWAAQAFLGTLWGLNDLILGDAGYRVPLTQLTAHPASVLLTRALAFAYLYHYLNWFAKVELIGWARISPRRGVAIVLLWLGAVALYFHDYLIGFAVLLALSLLHVVLEFPLNHRSLREIGGLLRMRRLADATRAPG